MVAPPLFEHRVHLLLDVGGQFGSAVHRGEAAEVMAQGLRLPVFEDGEVRLLEVGDRVPLSINDADVHRDHQHAAAKLRRLGRGWRLRGYDHAACHRQDGAGDERRQ